MTIYPLIPYIFLALGLIGALALFLSVKREMRAAAAKNRRQLDELAARMHEPKLPPEPVYLPAAPRSGMNLNKRTQALRMLRRGEDASHVAAAIGIAHSEVDLLIRVQRISSDATESCDRYRGSRPA